MNVSRLLNGKYSKFVISFILGLGIATLFRKACDKKNCMVFKAPPMETMKSKNFKFDGKCYKFEPEAVKCVPHKKIIKF
jgi:hypothetical protein